MAYLINAYNYTYRSGARTEAEVKAQAEEMSARFYGVVSWYEEVVEGEGKHAVSKAVRLGTVHVLKPGTQPKAPPPPDPPPKPQKARPEPAKAHAEEKPADVMDMIEAIESTPAMKPAPSNMAAVDDIIANINKRLGKA